MSYSEFTLEAVTAKFNLAVVEQDSLFPSAKPMKATPLLVELLERNVPLALAINTEKARSELIVAPVLVELRHQLDHRVSFFSGVDFNVDASLGLTGVCDYILSHSPKQLAIEAPVAVLVEAKKENLNAGLGQCIAEMVAARMFNRNKGASVPRIGGVVTSGSNWKFLELEEDTVRIDLTEKYISEIDDVLGMLRAAVGE